MNERYPVASTAALIADVSRAAMLTALLSGQALTAGELSRAANISAQSASMHLAQLLQGELVQGRRRAVIATTASPPLPSPTPSKHSAQSRLFPFQDPRHRTTRSATRAPAMTI